MYQCRMLQSDPAALSYHPGSVRRRQWSLRFITCHLLTVFLHHLALLLSAHISGEKHSSTCLVQHKEEGRKERVSSFLLLWEERVSSFLPSLPAFLQEEKSGALSALLRAGASCCLFAAYNPCRCYLQFLKVPLHEFCKTVQSCWLSWNVTWSIPP